MRPRWLPPLGSLESLSLHMPPLDRYAKSQALLSNSQSILMKVVFFYGKMEKSTNSQGIRVEGAQGPILASVTHPNNNVCGIPCVLVATCPSISDSRAPPICAASLSLSSAILILPVRRTSVVSSTSCPRGAMGRHAHQSNATRRRARCKGRLWRYDITAP